MLNSEYDILPGARAGQGTARGRGVGPREALSPPQSPRASDRPGRVSSRPAISVQQGRNGGAPTGDAGGGGPGQDEWTSRDTYDYALKRAAGYGADEERVAVAIFYSLFPDPGSCYASLEEKSKEAMRWCARAAIAALSERR